MVKRARLRRSVRLTQENAVLRTRLSEAELLLAAIRRGDLDALVVESPQGPQIYTLQSVERIYRVIVETMNEGALTLHSDDGTITYANQHLAALLALPLEQLISAPFRRFVAHDQHERLRQLLEAGRTGPGAAGCTLQRSDGSDVPVRLAVHPLQDTATTLLCVIVTDLTEHEQARAHLQEALEEKEVLLREIHHRVKNNLQVIMSLLRLQSRGIADMRVSSAFADTLERIRAMALVHEQLYAGGSLARVDAGAYLRTLIDSVTRSVAGRIPVRCELVPAVGIAMDIAMPLGLIVCELLTNSLKHGFPSGRRGTVTVRLTRDDTGLWLTVADDGVGLPAEIEHTPPTTLGLRIVRTLARQLGATLTLEAVSGTSARLCIPTLPGRAIEGLERSAAPHHLGLPKQ